jgi:chromosome segregation ATPase
MADGFNQLQIQADEIKDLEAEVKRLRRSRTEVKIDAAKSEERAKAWRDKAKEQEKELDEQQYEIDELRKERDSRDSDLGDYIYENERLKETVRSLEDQVLRLEAEYEGLVELYSGGGGRRRTDGKRCVRRESKEDRRRKEKK